MKKSILVIAIAALALCVNAGNWGKAPLDGNAGATSDDVYRGARFGLFGNYWSALTDSDRDSSHCYATASLPVTLNYRTTLSSTQVQTGSLSDSATTCGEAPGAEAQSAILRGGVSLSVSF